MVKKSTPYHYGDTPPTNWRQASDVLKSLASKPKRKSTGLMERLAAIEVQLKERK